MEKKKILVVDDERHIVRIIQVNLERAGYEVIIASNGLDALKRVHEERPDLVTLDNLMPVMNGKDILKNLKENPKTRAIPVMMLITLPDPKNQFACDAEVFKFWQLGADCVLTKPFNPLEVLTFVARIFCSIEENDQV